MAHKDKDRDSAGMHGGRADAAPGAQGDAEDTGPRTLTTAVYWTGSHDRRTGWEEILPRCCAERLKIM